MTKFSRTVYLDENAPAMVLLGITLKQYGLDALDYEPALLRTQIERDYDINLSEMQFDKLQAAMTVMSSDTFFDDWVVFETVCHLFHNEPVDADLVTPLDAEDIAVAMVEVTLIRRDIGDNTLVFDEEVRAYAGHVFYEYGLSHAPKIFPSAIMPKAVEVPESDKEKEDALMELFNTRLAYVLDYIKSVV